MMDDSPRPNEIKLSFGEIHLLGIHLSHLARQLSQSQPSGGEANGALSQINRSQPASRFSKELAVRSQTAANLKPSLSLQLVKRNPSLKWVQTAIKWRGIEEPSICFVIE